MALRKNLTIREKKLKINNCRSIRKKDHHYKSSVSPMITNFWNPMQELMLHSDAFGWSKWVFSQQQQRLCLFKPSSKTSPQFAKTQRVHVLQFAGSYVSNSAERRHPTRRQTEPGSSTDCYSWTNTWLNNAVHADSSLLTAMHVCVCVAHSVNN